MPVTPGRVAALTGVCSSIENDCLDPGDFGLEKLRINRLLESKGFKASSMRPRPRANYCCADRASSFVIDPSGLVYKCWNDIGMSDRAVGRLDPKPAGNDGLESGACAQIGCGSYGAADPFSDEKCLECKVLPLCMGGCPAAAINKGKRSCDEWKYNLEKFLVEAFIDGPK